ncbi:hypothetical protein RclHR1_00030046 [Rhizophagus clarus]|uniref:Uncharacterized protein n=1 Tax=Rhizophagus clarus TaxID=94130 RepID=A0A2Z6RJZ4_9GLOM|nr:hypothetical protein RclHR1_00030046 [Rhizophagus clarus]
MKILFWLKIKISLINSDALKVRDTRKFLSTLNHVTVSKSREDYFDSFVKSTPCSLINYKIWDKLDFM